MNIETANISSIPEDAARSKTETYLVFHREAHSVIYFVQASSVTEAVVQYCEQIANAALQDDGSILDEGVSYPHPLAYIEASEKINGEWQIRRMPGWVFQKQIVGAFCGESEDGPTSVIADCRKLFRQPFPRSRAKAFVWYLRQGTLVTFYRRQRPRNITVLKRYFWDWRGGQLTVKEWEGDYNQIIENLSLEPPHQ